MRLQARGKDGWMEQGPSGPRKRRTEGAGAFRPLNTFGEIRGFSHGPFVYASHVRLAPQETRTYFVTTAKNTDGGSSGH